MDIKILLINLKSPELAGQKQTFMPPIHLWKIRSTLHTIKHVKTIDICDEHIGDKCENYFKMKKYDIVGISCRFSIQHREYIRVSKLSDDTGAMVIAGGIHAAYVKRPISVDQSTRMKGEEYFKSLFDTFYEEDINFYPPPYFAKNEIEIYWNKDRPHDLQSVTDKWISLVTSTGCNRKCGFCGINGFMRTWQPHSLKYIENYLKYLKTFGIEELFIEDDNVSLDKQRFLDLIELFKKYNFMWSCPNGIYVKSLMDEEVMKSLFASGCWRLSLPFETGSKKTAKLMNLGNKWIPFEDANRIVDNLNRIGIKTCGFFIIGYPGETEEDIRKTFDYANRLNLDQRNIYIATPYPGTELYKICLDKKYIQVDNDFYGKLLYKSAIINTPELSAERVLEMKKEDRDRALERIRNKGVAKCFPNKR